MAKKRVKKKSKPIRCAKPKIVMGTKKKKVSLTLAVTALILNLFTFGIGSMVGGKIRAGVWQVVLFILGAVLALLVANWFSTISFVAWIWAIITGVQLIQEAR
ncbi:MAG: hypothetical protein KJ600_02485 [Nanoarchaeota archaeon]|nr:hypothetical protein [Nanoarchaeota archaeon]MBU1103401.1 hypothetical protein [Nanoarchaeota archaeon]